MTEEINKESNITSETTNSPEADVKKEETNNNVSEEKSDIIIKELKEKVNELNDKYLRLYSEFDNFRKRTLNEKIELTKCASADIMECMLPVLDDFDRAMKSIKETTDNNAVKEGVNLIHNKYKSILNQKGLKEMDCLGKTFNTDLHEAITNIPATSKKMKGKIVEVIEKGYYLNEKVLRYAKVVVAN